MSLYRKIRDLREDADKTQTDIAKYLGTTAQYYGKYENGEREIPFARAIKLADYYGVSLDYLADRTSAKNNYSCDFLTDDEKKVVLQFIDISERNREKVEKLADMFSEEE